MATSYLDIVSSYSYVETTQSPQPLGSWTNNTGSTQRISALTVHAGTGYGTFTAGDYVVGDGQPISLRAYIGSTYTNYVTLSNQVGVSQGGTNYPDTQTYTLTFSTPVSVPNGSAVTIYGQWSGGTCLCIGCSTYTPDTYKCYVTYSNIEYTLTYDANGGTGGPGPQTTQTTSITLSTVEPSKSFTVSAYPNGGAFDGQDVDVPTVVTRNCTFNGWATSKARADQGISDYSPGQTITISGNTVLWAAWENPRLGDLPAPFKQATFTGWNTEPDGSGTYYTSTSSISENITIYALWDIPDDPTKHKFTVNFYDGTSLLISYTDIPYGGSLTQAQADAAFNRLTPAKKREFKRWSSPYTDITTNTDIFAMYQFGYVWIMTQRGWVIYEPEEEL